jgi:nitrogen regulatory protein PII
MKLVRAVIRIFKLDDVREALLRAGVEGLTVAEVRGSGRQLGHQEAYRGVEVEVDLLPRLELEVVVPDGRVGTIVEAIEKSAYTGRLGDGQVFIEPVLDAIRIRTGERGEQAL